MSPPAVRRLLWLVLVVTLPLPFLGVATGMAPALRMLFLGTLVAALYVQDPDYLSQVIGLLLLGQGLAYTLLLYLVARLLTAALGRLHSARARNGCVAALVAGLLLASLLPIYRTPFSSTGERSSLLQVFD